MTTRQNHYTGSFQRIKAFFLKHGGDFAAGSEALKQSAAIDAACGATDTGATTQVAGKGAVKTGSEELAIYRADLHGAMEAIARTARGMALDTPGLDGKFHMPRSGSGQALLASARAFAQDAGPLKDAFIAHEMPADFIDHLNGLIDQFVAAGGDKDTGALKQVGGTAGVKTAVANGLIARQKLNAIVPNKYQNNAAVLAEWVTAWHVEAPPSKKKPAPPTK